MASQVPGVSSSYPPHTCTLQQGTEINSTAHQSSNIFFESEIKKGSEIVIPQSQHMTDVKQESEIHVHCQQNVYYGSKDVSPELEVSMYARTSEITSTTADTSYTEISQSSQVCSSTSMMGLPQAHSSSLLQEGPPKASQSDKSHMCLTCGKAFRNKPQLTQHELVHNGIRKHVCSYCEKAFKQICHLNQHIRVHTGERPYKCIIEGCGRAFAQLSNLNHHQKNHEEHVRRDVSRQFRCEVCDRSYANHNSLQTHIMKLHSNVKPEDSTLIQGLSPPAKKKKKSKVTTEDNPRYSVSAEQGDTFLVNFAEAEADGLPSQVRTKSNLAPKAVQVTQVPLDSKNQNSGHIGTLTAASLSVPYQSSPVPSLAGHYQNSPQTHEGQGHMDSPMTSVMSERDTRVEVVSSSVYSQSKMMQYHNQHQLQQSFSVPPREATPISSDLPSIQMMQHQARLLQHGGQGQGVGDRSSPLVGQQLPPRSSPMMQQQQSQPTTHHQTTHQQPTTHHQTTHQQPTTHHQTTHHQTSHQQASHQQAPAESPSHITHHYPDSESQNKAGRPQLFNPAFTDHSGRYSQNQF